MKGVILLAGRFLSREPGRGDAGAGRAQASRARGRGPPMRQAARPPVTAAVAFPHATQTREDSLRARFKNFNLITDTWGGAPFLIVLFPLC